MKNSVECVEQGSIWLQTAHVECYDVMKIQTASSIVIKAHLYLHWTHS